ncbi:MAG TPA: hypothetical protein VK485_00655 [Sphingomicrobium sp.]|nr:hypothetical protein [Sphingomicrobium sp.]
MIRKLSCLALALSIAGCTGGVGGGEYGFNSPYSLVRATDITVGDDSLVVTAPHEWNRARPFFFDDVRWVEDWTLNGPLLDSMSFVSGLPGGKYLVRQSRRADRQVPKFRSDMTAPEVAAMIESLYRVRAGTVDFRTIALQPRPFVGTNGFQFDYEHLDTDELWRRGRAVGAVVNGELYLIILDGARSHYFDAAAPDFEAIVNSARIRR